MASRACVLLLLILAVMSTPANQTFAGESAATGKERLSDKGSDNQRTDNCRVPIDRRGNRARPDCKESTNVTSATKPAKSPVTQLTR